jgi:hypothetical protein
MSSDELRGGDSARSGTQGPVAEVALPTSVDASSRRPRAQGWVGNAKPFVEPVYDRGHCCQKLINFIDEGFQIRSQLRMS